MDSYNPNSTVRLTATFAASGVAADPTVVICSLVDPNGQAASATVVHDGTGIYHADFVPTVSGIWTYTFAGTDAVLASATGQFFVEPA